MFYANTNTNETTSQSPDKKILFLDEADSDSSTSFCEDDNRYNKNLKRFRNIYKPDIVDRFKAMQDEIMKEHIPILTALLEETSFEAGYESIAEKYFNDLRKQYGVIADTILQNIYLQNMYEKPYLLKHLLFIVANLPEGQRSNSEIILIAGVNNPNIEIQDLCVKCFETWEEKRHIPTLKKIYQETQVEWFKRYVKDVIDTLEEG